MYDTMLANRIYGSSTFLEGGMDGSEIRIGYASVESNTNVSRYFVITGLPLFVKYQLFNNIRWYCDEPNVKINCYTSSVPHKIQWESSEMKNKMSIWGETIGNDFEEKKSAFEYRRNFEKNVNSRAIQESTLYFNTAELEQKRTLCRVVFYVEFRCEKEGDNLEYLERAVNNFKVMCKQEDIKYKQVKTNVVDWVRQISMFSTRNIKEVYSKTPKRVVTDDVLAQFSNYKQGRVGYRGIPIGVDIISKMVALKTFKENPDEAENILIAGETGAGKSFFVKDLITYLMAAGFVCTVLDYEGDEYKNIAAYLAASNKNDVRVISMGKRSSNYVDPMPIPELTGDPDVDDGLQEDSIRYAMSMVRIMVKGLKDKLSRWEERVVSVAIKNVYESVGVTDEKETWARSENLKIEDVYDEVNRLIRNKSFINDDDVENKMHNAALDVQNALAVYFEPGESKYGTFANPIRAKDVYDARFIVFEFGMKGATSNQIDADVLALKQLSVANISIQISNHCKYTRHCFNVKVWEEYQRWGAVEGSAEIIVNAMTGGRKRGDVNLLVTNNLAEILDEENKVAVTLAQNFQTKIVGGIDDKSTIKKFCKKFGLEEIQPALYKISKENKRKNQKDRKGRQMKESPYSHAFCVMLGENSAIVKVKLPKEILNSKLYRTGVHEKEDD